MPKIKLLLVSLLLSAITSAQTTSSKQAIVQQTIIKLFTAISNSDTAGLKLHSTSNVKFYEYGQIWTIDTMIQKMMVMSKAEDFKRINSFEFVNTTINKKQHGLLTTCNQPLPGIINRKSSTGWKQLFY